MCRLPLTTEQLARENAVRLAQYLQMGRTAVAIQDGCSMEVALRTAFEEHMALHSRCPCCRGSAAKASEIAGRIAGVMGSYPSPKK